MSDAMDSIIAQGPGRVDFSPLGDLFKNYTDARLQKKQTDVLNAFSGGVPTNADGTPNYDAVSAKLMQVGDMTNGAAMAHLAAQQRQEKLMLDASRTFSAGLSRVFGGQQAQPTSQAAVAPSYFDRLSKAESGNNDAATSTTSNASGRYQFQPATWASVAQAHPDLGLTPQGINDPVQQQKAVQAFTADNANALKSAGQPVNDANLYLAHFLGPAGADHFLKGYSADPNAPAASMVGPAAVNANYGMFFNRDRSPVSADAFYKNLAGRIAPPAASPASPGGPMPTGTSISGVPSEQLIPVLAAAASHPGLPPAARDVAKQFLSKALDESKSTPAEKEYKLYVSQERAAGRDPKTFNDWQNENQAEQANLKQVGEGYGKLLVDIQDQGRNAVPTMNTITYMSKLIDSPKFYSGTGGEYATQVKRALVSIGIKDANEAAPNELFQKLSNRLVLDANHGSLGTGFSNTDRDFIQASTANIANTPDGNRAILDLAMKVEGRKQEVAKFARNYAAQHGNKLDVGFDDALANWATQHPMFTDADRQKLPAPQPTGTQSAQLQKFSSPAQVRAAGLKSGDHFLDATGTERVMP